MIKSNRDEKATFSCPNQLLSSTLNSRSCGNEHSLYSTRVKSEYFVAGCALAVAFVQLIFVV